MKAATLFLGFTGLVLVAMLVLLWQTFGPRSGSPDKPAPLARTRPAPTLRPSEAEANGVRSVYPGVGGAPARNPVAEAPSERPPTAAALAQRETPAAIASDAPASAPDAAAPNAGEATGTIDLNTATLEQLNELGAGMVGKTIIAHRPYAAPDELIGRRVLNRRDYETIRPRVAVR